MATGQNLLDHMEMLDNETQVQSGEVDVTRALLALNAAQDQFEALVAMRVDLMGDTIGTVTTSANTESTAFPTGVLRIDRLQFIDPSTSRPLYDLEDQQATGGHTHRRRWGWPYYLASSSTATGRPVSYWTDGRNIYWDPLPDATHTVRWYGFQAASAITAVGTFAYPDICILPFAAFATKLLSMGVGDDSNDITSLALSTFRTTIDTLSNFRRDGARELHYKYHHTT